MAMDIDAGGGSDFEMSDELPPTKAKGRAAPKKAAAAPKKKAPARGKAKAAAVSEDEDEDEDDIEEDPAPAPAKRTNRAAVLRYALSDTAASFGLRFCSVWSH